MTRVFTAVKLSVGSIILSLGLLLASLSAFEQEFPGVFAGFILFVIGYKLAQTQANAYRLDVLGAITEVANLTGIIQLLMTLVGIGALTYGFTMLLDSMGSTNLSQAVLAAILLFAGYAMSHYAVNNTVL